LFKEYIVSFILHYGDIGILLALLLEFIGLPIPGEPLMSFVGFLSWKSQSHSLIVPIIFSVIGTNLGSIFAYVVGFKYGEDVVLKYGNYLFITREKLEKTTKLFRKNRISLLLFSRYIPVVRHVIPYLSGISKMKPFEYLTYNLIGSIIWCVSFVWLGFILGDKWILIEKLSHAYVIITVLIALFIFVVIKYFNKHKITIFLITFPILAFVKLSTDMIGDELSVFDGRIYYFLSSFISPSLTFIMRGISGMASPHTLTLIAVLSFVVLKNGKKFSSYAGVMAVNLITSALFAEVGRHAFHRQRPEINELIEVAGFSFPSDHSMIGISFYGLAMYLLYINTSKKSHKIFYAIVFPLLIFFVGISRVYLGVHFASDVLAGFMAGLAWLVIFIVFLVEYFQEKTHHHVSEL